MEPNQAIRISRIQPVGHGLIISGIIITILLNYVIGFCLIIVGLCLREHHCGQCKAPVSRHQNRCPHCQAEILLPPLITPARAAILVAAIAIAAFMLVLYFA